MVHGEAEFPVRERVRVEGHILDALILPKVLDLILLQGGNFRVAGIEIGQTRRDQSWAEIEVQALNEHHLEEILATLNPHGATPVEAGDCAFVPADLDGAFPEGFYSTTNMATEIRVKGHWIPVTDLEMDCGLVFEPGPSAAYCVPMHQVRIGDWVVVGRRGVRVRHPVREPSDPESFQFMTSAVSSEKPKDVTVRDIATLLRRTRDRRQKILVVGGPAIVHTGAAGHLCRLIREGFVQVLFAGNALATHDIEQALFHTSLGVHLSKGIPMHEGHEHHLRGINRIRRVGGIRPAVEKGVLQSGIMYECVKHNVDFLLAGSIRDDGPLPDVVTDTVDAIDQMRRMRDGVAFCLMIATMLHSIATGNILPAAVPIACVDINPATVTKLADRGTNSVGVVTDVEPFLRALVQELLGAKS